ncbi:MAG: hypothetical protein JOZ05_19900 [Acetobacteraceae bacterium]|nr:hypothetical protein [Acetobacteraceae bacterium]
MRLGCFPSLILACVALAALAARAQGADPSAACEQAAAVAERTYSLPPGLLGAIGRVESGRWDAATGRIRPWPWTLNAEGAGAFPPDYASAVAAVTALQARGTRSIDIGCFQVNLLQHPGAFSSLADGFLPAVNADYAARFLVRLRERTGGWPEAVAAYHSATPALGEPYWSKVSLAWGEASVPLRTAMRMPELGAVPGIHVWAPEQPGAARAWIQMGATALPTVIYAEAVMTSKK